MLYIVFHAAYVYAVIPGTYRAAVIDSKWMEYKRRPAFYPVHHHGHNQIEAGVSIVTWMSSSLSTAAHARYIKAKLFSILFFIYPCQQQGQNSPSSCSSNADRGRRPRCSAHGCERLNMTCKSDVHIIFPRSVSFRNIHAWQVDVKVTIRHWKTFSHLCQYVNMSTNILTTEGICQHWIYGSFLNNIWQRGSSY